MTDNVPIPQSYRKLLQRRGFDPDIEIHECFGCFTLSEAKASLFDSTRFAPKSVYLEDAGSDIRSPVVIELARALYLPEDIADIEEYPNWYFEGYVPDQRRTSVIRVRIHMSTDGTGQDNVDDIFSWQRIPDQETQ